MITHLPPPGNALARGRFCCQRLASGIELFQLSREETMRFGYSKREGLQGCLVMAALGVFTIAVNLALLAAATWVIARVACWALLGFPWC